MNEFRHISVLADELVTGLNLAPGQTAIDCTAGGGGHTRMLLDRVGKDGRVVAIDRDPKAIEAIRSRLPDELDAGQLILVENRFSEIGAIAADLQIASNVAGICADLGVSSPQLDTAERGFSFMHEGPLDMRMSQRPDQERASDIVNSWEFEEIRDILQRFGEEPMAGRIASAICRERDKEPILTTQRLADICQGAVRYKTKSRKHPATKTFQALRIVVNRELGELEDLLSNSFDILGPGGRLGIISFHSLEDRIVKKAFRKLAENPANAIPKEVPISVEDLAQIGKPKAKIIKPFPASPNESESNTNPRARSAKLRILEKL